MATRYFTHQWGMVISCMSRTDVLDLLEECADKVRARDPERAQVDHLHEKVRAWRANAVASEWILRAIPAEGIERDELEGLARRQGLKRPLSVLDYLRFVGRVHLERDAGQVRKGPPTAVTTSREVPPLDRWVTRTEGMTEGQSDFYARYKTAFFDGEIWALPDARGYAHVLMREIVESDPRSPRLPELLKRFDITRDTGGRNQAFLVDHYLLTSQLQNAFNADSVGACEFLAWQTVIPGLYITPRVLDTIMRGVGSNGSLTDVGAQYRDEIAARLAERLNSDQDMTGTSVIRRLLNSMTEDESPTVVQDWMGRYPQQIPRVVVEEYASAVGADQPRVVPAGRSLFLGTDVATTIDWPSYIRHSNWQLHVVRSHLRMETRDAENDVRVRLDLPRVGEAWVSEAALLRVVREAFPGHQVVHQGRPAWLRPQSLDIFLPEVNVGIEYQGEQHSRPVERFGGEEAFKGQQRRDARKRRLCNEHACVLIEVYPHFDPAEVIASVQAAIDAAHRPNAPGGSDA